MDQSDQRMAQWLANRGGGSFITAGGQQAHVSGKNQNELLNDAIGLLVEIRNLLRDQRKPDLEEAMNKDVEYAIKAQLGNAEDNLYRATLAAKRCDASQQWGESGQTLQQIINGYQAEVDRWKRALASLT